MFSWNATQLILAISGVRLDSNGYGQASTDFYNPVKGTNNERTTCAVDYHTSSGAINSTNACYAGYYDQMLSLCYYSHTCNKYNPIKPIDYPPKVIPLLPPPPIENSTRLVYDGYYGAGFVQGKDNEIADNQLNYTTPDDRCPYPDPPYVSYCKGYDEGYDFYWRISTHPKVSTQSVQITSGNATKFLEYENSTYGIKMHYPSHWLVEGANNSSIVASFYPQRNNAGYVTVQIENLTIRFTPDQYLNSLMRGDAA